MEKIVFLKVQFYTRAVEFFENDEYSKSLKSQCQLKIGEKNTLETSGEDVKLHSKRVEKM